MTHPTFRQLATLLGGTYSASSMAEAEGIHWPPPPSISLRRMLSFHPKVKSIQPPTEPKPPRTSVGAGYYDGPPDLLDPNAAPMDCSAPTTDGRVNSDLRAAAQERDGSAILRRVAGLVAQNAASLGAHSQDLITAMTQLAVTGSNAFAAWSANPTQDLTSFLIQQGMSAAAAGTANQQIMSDFNAARQAVRNPGAGINESSLRQGLKHNWIAVSGEDDPPDYPVNVDIAKYPQYHVPVTVPTPKGVNSSINLSIRCVIASQGATSVPDTPFIPPGNEVVLYIHGEGSRAEEAGDFVPALFSVGAAAGRSFTVVAFDQPSCGYSTVVPHLNVAPMPPTSGPFGVIDTSSFSGSPILDFVEAAIVALVEALIIPTGNPITAVVGGSLGGHMALRLAARQKDWVRNVIAWSPASVMDHDFFLGFTILGDPIGVTESQRLLTDPTLAGRATESEAPGTRSKFFDTVWCQNTFDPHDADAAKIAAALLSAGVLSGALAPVINAFGGAAVDAVVGGAVAAAYLNLPTVPPQPQMWYRDDWASKPTYIEESRRDRREVYNANFRQWHWRICEEMIGFTFDALVPTMKKPLLLMVGEKDDYPEVHFLSNVTNFASSLTAPAQGVLTIQDTGHSIHNERPSFLAHQVVNFASPL
jgi:pimeloyl-ACP methyl ester carboxylesterase